MAKITNVVDTKFTATGAKNVEKQTQSIGRAQTRLGQASASAGRQFSAQANGLGGLVTAYAGAAANVFAISAAFLALSRAAQFEQVIAGTNQLATSIGANGQEIIATVQEITKNQLNLLETAQTVNIGLAAGFNTSQIDALSDVSLRASKALGRSLTDAFTRVSRGAAKLEPELLDELGIFTRIDPAVRKYADSLGVSVSSLTNFERRQAFVNAVIEEGQFKFRDVDTTTNTASESLEKLAAVVTDLGLKFGALLANGLSPVADFISGSLSNSVAVFGLLARTVGNSAVAVLTAGINASTTAILNFGLSSASALNNVSGSFNRAIRSVQEFSAANKLSISSVSQKSQALNQQLIVLQSDIAANRLKTRAELEAAQAVLQAAIAEGRAAKARATSTVKIKLLRRELALLRVEQSKVNAALAASTVASGVAAKALTGLAKGVSVVGSVLGGVISKLFLFITVISLVQLGLDALGKIFGFNVDIFEKAGNVIKAVVDRFTQTSRAVRAFSSGFVDDMSRAAEAAGAFGEQVAEATKLAEKSLIKFIKDAQAFSGVGGIFGVPFDQDTQAALRVSTSADILEALRGRIEDLKKESAPAAAALKTLTDNMIELGRGDILAGFSAAIAIERLAKGSGLATSEVTQLVKGVQTLSGLSFDVTGLGDLSLEFRGFGIQLTQTSNGLTQFVAGAEDIGPKLLASFDSLKDFNQDFLRGTLDAEKAAQAVGRTESTIIQLKEAQTALQRRSQQLYDAQNEATREQNVEESKRLATLQLQVDATRTQTAQIIKQLEIDLEINRVRARRLAILEKEGKIFDKVFGKSGEKLERLIAEGAFSASGARATSSIERDLNQINYLTGLIEESERSRAEDLDLQSKNQLKQRDNLVAQIEQETEKLSLLMQQGAAEDAIRNQSEKVVNTKEKLSSLEGKLTDKASDYLETQELGKKAADALVRVREKVLAGLEKELRSQQRITRQLEMQAAIAKNNFQIEKNKGLLAENERINNSLKKQLEFEKKLLELRGQLTTEAGLQSARDEVIVTLRQSAEDRRLRLDQARLESDNAKIRAENADFDRKFSLEERKERINIIKQQLAGLSAFNQDLDAILKARVEDFAKAFGTENFTASTFKESDGKLNVVTTEFSKLSDEFDKYITRQSNAIKSLDEETRNTYEQRAANQRAAIQDEFEQTVRANIERLALEELNANLIFQIYKDTNEIIRGSLTEGFTQLFDAIADGTLSMKSFKEGLIDLVGTTFDKIRQTILEKTLIDPIANKATEALGGLFGIDDITQEAIGSAEKVALQAATADFQIQLSTVTSTVTTATTGVATAFTTAGSTASTSLSTLGGQVAAAATTFAAQLAAAQATLAATSATSSAGSIISVASGGYIPRFASGGQMRDRVPALLEPGEFVIRRPMAKAIGGPALNAMNATGSMPGNVSINIQNDGTPKDAEASQPRFDGEKFVVDIVMRDLRNNGPIRKSLRAGG